MRNTAWAVDAVIYGELLQKRLFLLTPAFLISKEAEIARVSLTAG
jgi:hypothetical protein